MLRVVNLVFIKTVAVGAPVKWGVRLNEVGVGAVFTGDVHRREFDDLPFFRLVGIVDPHAKEQEDQRPNVEQTGGV